MTSGQNACAVTKRQLTRAACPDAGSEYSEDAAQPGRQAGARLPAPDVALRHGADAFASTAKIPLRRPTADPIRLHTHTRLRPPTPPLQDAARAALLGTVSWLQADTFVCPRQLQTASAGASGECAVARARARRLPHGPAIRGGCETGRRTQRRMLSPGRDVA